MWAVSWGALEDKQDKILFREVPKVKCHQCSKQYKSENSIWGFGIDLNTE